MTGRAASFIVSIFFSHSGEEIEGRNRFRWVVLVARAGEEGTVIPFLAVVFCCFRFSLTCRKRDIVVCVSCVLFVVILSFALFLLFLSLSSLLLLVSSFVTPIIAVTVVFTILF